MLRGALSDGALKAGAESLSQATATSLASTQLGELTAAAAGAATALL